MGCSIQECNVDPMRMKSGTRRLVCQVQPPGAPAVNWGGEDKLLNSFMPPSSHL